MPASRSGRGRGAAAAALVAAAAIGLTAPVSGATPARVIPVAGPPDGWTAELRIPYSQLRFPHDTAQVWGLNVARMIKRRAA